MSAGLMLQKSLGAFYTPDDVAKTLVKWAVRRKSDWLLDPACGDGRFLAEHPNCFGVDCDSAGAARAVARAPQSTVHVGDFFVWAQETTARFDCAAGNPPFIRYQQFAGEDRDNALSYCRKLGANFTALSSSWAPFLVVTASLLKPGGRMAFVVPAEIGHAPYAVPLVGFLTSHFAVVHLVAIREKVFADLSEDVWLLYAEGYGEETDRILLSQDPSFVPRRSPPLRSQTVSLADWSKWNCRLRPFLLPPAAREVYLGVRDSAQSVQMRDVARVGIGYVTGANDFFHLCPSEARVWRIPDRYLLPSVRNSRYLPQKTLTPATVRAWKERDEPFLLLRLRADESLPEPVQDYLDSPGGLLARTAYKCRSRRPWYVVPDVRTPDAFLSYMSGVGPQLVANGAGCSCTNSVHVVELLAGWSVAQLRTMWEHPVTRLSCEIEGHPLGGGMLKIEPGEGARIVLPCPELRLGPAAMEAVEQGVVTLRRWRHYE